MSSWCRQASSYRQPCGRRAVVMILILLLSNGSVLVRSTSVLQKEIAVVTSPIPESCARYYFCAKESYPTRDKRCSRQRRRHDEFMRKLQKKICEKIYELIKSRLHVKEFNIDSPCND